MFRRILLLISATALMSLPTFAQTVDEIVANHIKAAGGYDKLKAVKTVRISGKVMFGTIEAALTQENKRPNLTRTDISIQGKNLTIGYDGKVGWQINPFQGRMDAELLGEDDLKDIVEQADFDGPIIDAKEKGNKIEYSGKEPVEGTDTYKLTITLKNGDVRYYYLDTDSYLPLKIEQTTMIRGAARETFTIPGDYKEVEGLVFPFSVENGRKGSDQRQKVSFDKVELNPSVDDARFKMPAAAPAPAPKPEEKKPEEKKPEPKK